MTIRELAKLVGVSPATISIVLHGRKGVGEETRRKVLEAVKQYQYEPVLRNVAKNRSILLVKYKKSGSLIEENQGFISMIIDSIEEELRSMQYEIATEAVKGHLSSLLPICSSGDYCGMIVIASEITEELYGELGEIPIPFVIVDNTMPNYPYASVCMNNYENVWQILKYCRECGHSTLGYLKSSVCFENFRERDVAFHRCVKELGLAVDEKSVFQLEPTLLGACEGMEKILAGKPKLPTCFFADNDTIALGAIKALKANGYKIPRDVSIVGFDDIPYAAVSSPALTTVRVQREVIGKQAVYQLQKILEHPEFTPVKTAITGSLMIRESVKNINE